MVVEQFPKGALRRYGSAVDTEAPAAALAGAPDLEAACRIAVAALADEGDLAVAAYVGRAGRLRCLAAAGTSDVLDGVSAIVGPVGRAAAAGAEQRTLGPDGIRDVGETAVLNANYLMSLLRKEYNLPVDRICKHEFVLNDKDVPNGVTTNDIAKRILDYGFHAPTVYFPLLIPGAIMIEPTETETRETLEAFAGAMIAIKREAESDPETVKSAPHTTPVRKVDAVLAGDFDPSAVPTSPTGVSAWRPNPHGALERRYYVYKRQGGACRVCGSRVRMADVAGRNLYWCGRCQRRR